MTSADDGRTRTITVVALAAAAVAVVLTFFTWVDFSAMGIPFRWNGLGFFSGLAHYRDIVSINPVCGWAILLASLATSACLTVLASRWAQAYAAALSASVIAFAAAALCLISPGLMTAQLLEQVGASDLPVRTFVNTPVLVAEAVATAVLLMATALMFAAQRARTTSD